MRYCIVKRPAKAGVITDEIFPAQRLHYLDEAYEITHPFHDYDLDGFCKRCGADNQEPDEAESQCQ